MFRKRSAADDLKDELVLADAYGRKPDQGSSVAEVLQQQLEPSEPSWHEQVMGWVRAENEAAKAQSNPKHASDLPRGVQSTVEALKEAIADSQQSDGSIPLNGQAILNAASAAIHGNRMVREEVGRLLHDYREGQQPAK